MRVADNRKELLLHIIGKSRPHRARAEAMEEKDGDCHNNPYRPKTPDSPRRHKHRSSTGKPSERERQPPSTSTCETKRSPPIKLKEYNGITPIETFFKHFRSCAAYYNWMDEDKGIRLRCQLTGNAANLLWAQPNADDVTYEELVRMLRGRIGSAD